MLIMLLDEKKRKPKKRPKKEDTNKRKSRIAQIKSEIKAKIRKEQEKRPGKKAESIDEEVKKSKNKVIEVSQYSTTVQKAGVISNAYGFFEGNPEDLYLYRSKHTQEYGAHNLGENAAEINYKDIQEINQDQKFKDRGISYGSGKHIAVEKQERFKLHKMVGTNWVMNRVLYDLSLS